MDGFCFLVLAANFTHVSFICLHQIPLARKLKECNVFGVSSDECLSYAIRNRNEWKQDGEEILKEMLKECADSYGETAPEPAAAETAAAEPAVAETTNTSA